MTIDDLREGWLDQITKLNGMIEYLKARPQLHHGGQDSATATAAWLEKLYRWRADLEDLLTQFPDEGL